MQIQLNNSASAATIEHIHYICVSSTNDIALELFYKGQSTPVWITADQQTHGKGRLGHRWESPIGNFYGSLLLIDPAPSQFLPQLTFVASLALYQALSYFLPTHLQQGLKLKWPNDLLLNRKKIAGILLEGASIFDSKGNKQGLVIGFGINCARHPKNIPYPVTNLVHQGVSINIKKLFRRLSSSMNTTLHQWNRGKAFENIRTQWLSYVSCLGRPIYVRRQNNIMNGIFEGLSEEGHLLLRLTNGCILPISSGEVFVLEKTQ